MTRTNERMVPVVFTGEIRFYDFPTGRYEDGGWIEFAADFKDGKLLTLRALKNTPPTPAAAHAVDAMECDAPQAEGDGAGGELVGPMPRGLLRFSRIVWNGWERTDYAVCPECEVLFPYVKGIPRCNGHSVTLCPWCRVDSTPNKYGRGA